MATLTYLYIYSPENEGYWVGGYGESAEFSMSFEGATLINTAEIPAKKKDSKMQQLLDKIDPAPDSEIWYKEKQFHWRRGDEKPTSLNLDTLI